MIGGNIELHALSGPLELGNCTFTICDIHSGDPVTTGEWLQTIPQLSDSGDEATIQTPSFIDDDPRSASDPNPQPSCDRTEIAGLGVLSSICGLAVSLIDSINVSAHIYDCTISGQVWQRFPGVSAMDFPLHCDLI